MSTVLQPAAAHALLAVNNIEVIYDHVILVLKGVSLEVQEGRIVALLGANGAGKSTTLKSISNLLRAERGEVTKGSIEFRGQRVDILLREEQVTEIEQLEIRTQELARHVIVQRLVSVMALFQQAADRHTDLFGIRFGL